MSNIKRNIIRTPNKQNQSPFTESVSVVHEKVINEVEEEQHFISPSVSASGKGKVNSSPLLFNLAEMLLEREREYYGKVVDSNDPLLLAEVSYNQVNLIPIRMVAQYQRIWDFCVGYASVAMGRRGLANTVVTISSGPIGLYYFAAVTLFYALYECTVGAIPPLQRISKELRDLFQAIAPVNKNGRAYTTIWNQEIETLIKNLPYNSYQNPGITLAPHTGSQNAQGQILLVTVVPNITLDDVNEFGPDAFEEVQRYFLGNKYDQMKLVSYTMDGPWYFNTSAFPVTKPTTNPPPINGVVQISNEVSLPTRDHWLMMLGFFAPDPVTVREGWTAKTIQTGTHLALYRILTGASATDSVGVDKSLVHMVNYNLAMSQDLSVLIAAEFNSATDDTIKDLDDTALVDFGYLSQMSAGEYMTYVLCVLSRRFWLVSALSAGTPMPDPLSTVIGAGSAYLTRGSVDTLVGFMSTVEDLAALSTFVHDGVMHLPVLTMRGGKQTVDVVNPGGTSVEFYLNTLYPSTISTMPRTYDFMPYVSGPADTLDLTYNALAPACFTQGGIIDQGVDVVSSIIASLQANAMVGSASGSRDGPRTQHLWLTHYMLAEDIEDGFDLSVQLNVLQLLSTQPCDPRHMANLLTRFFPVMYGDQTKIGAYQAIYARTNSVEVSAPYLEYRGPTIISAAHKRAANILAPAEQQTQIVHDTIIGAGGNFIDMFFKGGNWVSAAENLAGGLGSLISPQFGKKVKGIVGKVGKAIHEAFKSNDVSEFHHAPVAYGFVDLPTYISLMGQMDRTEKRKSSVEAKRQPPIHQLQKKKKVVSSIKIQKGGSRRGKRRY